MTLEAALNQMPQFAPSGSAGNGGQGTGGHATVNLHGLGANRNLVLLDGRRLPLADIFGTVDINLVPESILSSVQTITGGASAVYGSDAMSGVVNFISLDHFEGATFDAQYGNTEQGDRSQTKASLAFGTKFAEDAGHALLSVGYTDREGSVSARPDAVLRSPDAVLVHRPGHVRAFGDEPAEPGRRQHPVRDLRRRDAGGEYAEPRVQRRRHAVHADRREELQGANDGWLRDHRGQRAHAGAEGVHRSESARAQIGLQQVRL